MDGYFVASHVVLPAEPKPWLRLAHLHGYDGRHAGQTRLRRLLDHEFILQVRGESWIHLADLGGSIPLPQGSLAWITPDLRHGQGPTRGDHIAVHFDLVARPELAALDMVVPLPELVQRNDGERQACHLVDLGEEVRRVPLVQALPDPSAWRRRFEILCRQWMLRRHHSPAARLQASALLATSLVELLELAARDTVAAEPGPRRRIAELLAGIDIADHSLRIADLAARAGLGETAFRAAVRHITGRSPHRWLEERRCELARRLLLDSTMSVAAVAAACGYEDPYHFSRVMKRITGQSPSAHRLGMEQGLSQRER